MVVQNLLHFFRCVWYGDFAHFLQEAIIISTEVGGTPNCSRCSLTHDIFLVLISLPGDVAPLEQQVVAEDFSRDDR